MYGNLLKTADWDKSVQIGGELIDEHRVYLNDAGIGSYLGSDEELAQKNMGEMFFSANPLLQAVNGALDASNVAYDEYAANVYGVSKEKYFEYRKTDPYLKAGKWAFDGAKIAAGTALTLAAQGANLGAGGSALVGKELIKAQLKFASRALATNIGFSSAVSVGNELVKQLILVKSLITQR